MSRNSDAPGGIALAVGPVVAIATAGILSRFRDDAGSANVALALAIVVVAAASAGRRAGAATAVTAALGYNFFHTQPYNSLRINRGHDVFTVILLVVIGISVSETNEWRRRLRRSSDRHQLAEGALERTTALLANRAGPDVVWNEVQSALQDLLRVTECRFEPGTRAAAPEIPRSGALVSPHMHMGLHGFRLPDQGAAIAVVYGGATLGHIILGGEAPGGGSSIAERQAALALADQYGVSLSIPRPLV